MNSFYKDKRILVTGHTGFKGSWLCKTLVDLNANVFGVSLSKTKGGLYELLRLDGNVSSHFGDVNDLSFLKNCAYEIQPEIIFHLAAQPLVLEGIKNPVTTFHTNVMGVVNVLEVSRYLTSVKSCLIITTDKVYDLSGNLYSYKEIDPIGGKDPYSASKAAAEIIVNSYRETYLSKDTPFSLATARAGNVIGGGDFSTDRIIPDCYNSILSKKQIKLRNPTHIRPWQHVIEPIFGYLILAKSIYHAWEYSGAYNFGPNYTENYTVEHLAQKFCEYFDFEQIKTNHKSHNTIESETLRIDSTKSKELLGWYPALDFERTIEWTAKWYKLLKENQEVITETENQIHEYKALISNRGINI